MSATHVILGTGKGVKSPRSVINEAFRDALHDGDTLSIPWFGGTPSDSMAFVYDYVLDNDIQFLLLHEQDVKPPKPFVTSEAGQVLKVLDIPKAMSDHVAREEGGSAFVLGEDGKTDEFIKAFDQFSNVPMKDLSNGLIPIILSNPAAEAAPAEEPEVPAKPLIVDLNDEVDPTDDDPHATGVEEADAESFSPEELADLPVRVLKRVAGSILGESAVPVTQEAILEAIAAHRTAATDEAVAYFGGNHADVPTSDVVSALRDALSLLEDDVNTRHKSIAKTKIHEAILWYSHGLEVE